MILIPPVCAVLICVPKCKCVSMTGTGGLPWLPACCPNGILPPGATSSVRGSPRAPSYPLYSAAYAMGTWRTSCFLTFSRTGRGLSILCTYRFAFDWLSPWPPEWAGRCISSRRGHRDGGQAVNGGQWLLMQPGHGGVLDSGSLLVCPQPGSNPTRNLSLPLGFLEAT